MRFKKTEICTTCAKLKNACQSCILDLQYHLPTQVRDAALGSSVKIPMSDINRQYFVNRMDALLEGTDTETTIGPTRAHPEWLTKMASHEPDYKRNRPPVCSFYARGTCTRGEACPYRHEPTGSSAPTSSVPPALAPPRPKAEAPALRLQKAAGAKPLAAPANPSIKSIFFTGLPDVTAEELQALLVASIPRLTAEDVAEVKMVSASHCAFVVFATREKAEQVAEALAMKMDIKGKDVRVAWSRK
ncbi:Pre-mRNA-splicing factor Slt11 [Malassezia pachydermatis]